MQSTMKFSGRPALCAAAIFALLFMGTALVPLACEACAQLGSVLETYWSGMALEAGNFYALRP